MLRLDHVVFAVPDLDEVAVRFRERFGLDSTEGGRHERWGTANRIVPLGDQYVELVAAVDETAAARTGFGRGVLERAAGGGGWFTIAAGAEDLDAVADRLGLEIGSGSRTRPDGEILRWRSAGLDDPRREPWMPFFLAWGIWERSDLDRGDPVRIGIVLLVAVPSWWAALIWQSSVRAMVRHLSASRRDGVAEEDD